MSDDTQALLAAEKRGYGKGYAAGKRHRGKQVRIDQNRRQRQAFRQRAFLAVLPFAMGANGWVRGENPINSLSERVRLAVEIADEAMKAMP